MPRYEHADLAPLARPATADRRARQACAVLDILRAQYTPCDQCGTRAASVVRHRAGQSTRRLCPDCAGRGPTPPSGGPRGRSVAEAQAKLDAAMKGTPTLTDLRRQKLAAVLDSVPTWARVPSVPEMRAWLDDFLREHRITVRWEKPAGAGACAHLDTRVIRTPAVVDEASFAVAMHEVGHVLAPRCDLHRLVRLPWKGERTWSACASCEVRAWVGAFSHAKWWTRAMHEKMTRSVTGYQRWLSADDERALLNSLTTATARRRAALAVSLNAHTHGRKIAS